MIEAHNAIADLLDNRSLAEMRMLASAAAAEAAGLARSSRAITLSIKAVQNADQAKQLGDLIGGLPAAELKLATSTC